MENLPKLPDHYSLTVCPGLADQINQLLAARLGAEIDAIAKQVIDATIDRLLDAAKAESRLATAIAKALEVEFESFPTDDTDPAAKAWNGIQPGVVYYDPNTSNSEQA